MKIFKNKDLTYMDEKEKVIQKAYDYIQSLKNYDYVEYTGGEMWKPHRNFKDFKLTYKDLKIKKKEFDDLKRCMESVWHFCDTIFIGDEAEEDNYHVLDYCFHGERMGWKSGDEYWLVFNFACERFEIRKADPEKWTPLDKIIVNDDLELRFKLGYVLKDESKFLFLHKDYKKVKVKYIQDFGVNSFPDRIELHLHNMDERDQDLTSYSQILNYYIHKSPIYKDGYNKELDEMVYSFHFEEDKAIDILKNSFFRGSRYYNLYNENEKEDMDKVYETFLKYSHQLKFFQAHQNKRKKNEK